MWKYIVIISCVISGLDKLHGMILQESLLELKIALEEAAQRENIDVTSQRADQSTVDYIQSCVSAFKYVNGQ